MANWFPETKGPGNPIRKEWSSQLMKLAQHAKELSWICTSDYSQKLTQSG